MSQTGSSAIDWQQAVVVGLVAWLAGVVITFLIGQAGLNQGLSFILAFAPIAGSFLMYLAFQSWFATGGLGAAGGLAVFTLLPIVILLLAGYYRASQGGPADAGDGFRLGASITAGYLVGAILSIVVALVMLGGSGSSGLQLNADTIISLVVAGIVFPVVFGGVGGAVASEV